MKIICGIDFSEHAREAAEAAAAFTVKLQGTLCLVYVMDTSRYEIPSKELMDYLCKSRRTKLQIEGERLRHQGAKVEEQFLQGSPASGLVDAATEAEAGLIVVSSLGKIAPSRWLVGSVAERTAQNASVPTLVVRKGKPLEQWARGERILNVVVAYDFSESADEALRSTSLLSKIGPCRITVVYVAWPPEAGMRFGLGCDDSHPYYPAQVEKLLKRDLQEKGEQILGKAKLRFHVAAGLGRPDPQLIEIAVSQKADVIIVGTNQRRGLARLGSVSRGVLHHAPLNVVCVPLAVANQTNRRSIPILRHVLVTTDLSKQGARAIPFAYSLLRRGGQVCILHVIRSTRGRSSGALAGCRVSAGGQGSPRPGHSERTAKVRAQLQALIPAEAEALGISSQVEVVEHSDAATAICQTAECVGADVICMSSQP